MTNVRKMKDVLFGVELSLSTRASHKPGQFDGIVGQVFDLRREEPLFRGVLSFAARASQDAVESAAWDARICALDISSAEQLVASGLSPKTSPSGIIRARAEGPGEPRRRAGAPGAGTAVGRPWGKGPLVPVVVCAEPLSEELKDLLADEIGVGYVDRSGAAHVLHVDDHCTLSYFRGSAHRVVGAETSGVLTARGTGGETRVGKTPRKQERVLRALLSASSRSAGRVLRQHTEEGTVTCEPLLLRDVARLASVSLETAHRILKALEKEGLLEWKRRQGISIRKHGRLLDALEAAYRARQSPPLFVDAVDGRRVMEALSQLGGDRDAPFRAAVTGSPAHVAVLGVLWDEPEGKFGVLLDSGEPLRILVDCPADALPRAARHLSVEPLSSEALSRVPPIEPLPVYLHAAHDESLFYDSKKASKGIPFVSALQLYLDLRVLCATDHEAGLNLIRLLRKQTFPAYYRS